jgi:hypothetical protein
LSEHWKLVHPIRGIGHESLPTASPRRKGQISLENNVIDLALLQVVRQGDASLPGADDYGVWRFDSRQGIVFPTETDSRQSLANAALVLAVIPPIET